MQVRSPLPRYAHVFLVALAATGAAPSALAAIDGAPAPSSSTATGAGVVTVHLAPSLAGTAAPDAGPPRLLVDGAASALESPLELAAGQHVLQLEIDGRAPISRAVVVHAGDRLEVTLGEVEPSIERGHLGGVPPRVEPRGGCAGCGGSRGESTASLWGGAALLGLAVGRARRRR